MPKYTVGYGDAFSGMTFYGVFDDFDAAETWAWDENDRLGFYIVELQDV